MLSSTSTNGSLNTYPSDTLELTHTEGTLAKVDPDHMPQNAMYDQVLHCLH